MRVIVPQITWHSRDPVLSVDCDPSCNAEEGFYRLATGGGNSQLLVWRLAAPDTLKPELTCVAELKRHEKPINVVRFSPDGNYIASGGDDAYVIIWKKEGKSATGTDETWLFEKSLRKHIEDVSDLSWSPDGNFLVSGSIDNSAVLWDVKKGTSIHIWSEKEHTGFVHGVNYDPLHELIGTMCIDRTLRFFDIKTGKVSHKALKYPDLWINELQEVEEKENLPKNEATAGKDDVVVGKKKTPANYVNRLFQDESLPTFCRRLSFSPKGELLMVPGGMLPPSQNAADNEDLEKKVKEKKSRKKGGIEKPVANNNAVVLFCRNSWTTPCALIPTGTSYSIASRFCPVYFETIRKPYAYDDDFANPKKNERTFACVGKLAHSKNETKSIMKMPYRLVYAVATNDTIIIGDTASVQPLAVIRNVHFTRITDISWTTNGRALIASSTDGYCSIITFGEGELGSPFRMDDFPALTKDCFSILPPEPKVKAVRKKAPKAKVSKVSPAVKDAEKEKKEDKPKAKTGKKKRVSKAKVTSPVSSAVDVPAVPAAKVEDEPVVIKDVVVETPPRPKATPQRTTLDRWIKKTPKPEEKSGVKTEKSQDKKELPCSSTGNMNNVSGTKATPEVIVIDDDDSNPGDTEVKQTTAAPRIYPMTPPAPVRVVSSNVKPMSPLVTLISGMNRGVKRPQEGVSPEELHRLSTAPIKCRRLLDQPAVILQSSDRTIAPENNSVQSSNVVPTLSTSSGNVPDVPQAESPIVTDQNCPSSPVSSSSSKTPRRIQLIRLGKPGPNAGNLD